MSLYLSEEELRSSGNEKWVDVVGYEGLYLVSNKGRVFSLEKEPTIDSLGRMQRRRSTMLKLITNTKGYHIVNLSKNGVRKEEKVHRLVAKAFIDNPENLPFVNHKDEIRNNNNVENLEWCTHEYNMKYRGACLKAGKSLRKKIVGVNIKDGTAISLESMTSAKIYGFNRSAISECCRGKRGQYKGYKWFYEKDYLNNYEDGDNYGFKAG